VQMLCGYNVIMRMGKFYKVLDMLKIHNKYARPLYIECIYTIIKISIIQIFPNHQ
jgi:hypothetical protein